MKIAIIGAGWYGCHLALELTTKGHEVTLYEKKEDILLGTSGNFSIRLHVGAHYPRSEVTQDSCQRDKISFSHAYPEFVVPHKYSIYALGKSDALGIPTRVNASQFEKVCRRFDGCEMVKPEQYNFYDTNNVTVAFNFDEPSLVVGKRLRQLMKEKLTKAEVRVLCNHPISNLKPEGNLVVLSEQDNLKMSYDYVINATGYQDLLPKGLDGNFPIKMDVVYQPCLGLKYKDKKPEGKPVSFIVMDGFFPCLMPSINDAKFQNKYILTHGAYTILNSCDTADKAYEILHGITDNFVNTTIKRLSECEMIRFWPHFSERFEYIGWKGAVLAKIKTRTEFRSAVVFEKDRLIHVIPGKISNVMTVAPEVLALLNNEHCLTEHGIRFMQNGVLDDARTEIMTKPTPEEPNTCNLQTLDALKKTHDLACRFFSPTSEVKEDKKTQTRAHQF